MADPVTQSPQTRPRIPLWVIALATVPGALQLIGVLQGFWQARPPGLVYVGFKYMVVDHLSYMGLAEMARDWFFPALINPFVSEV